MGNQRRRTGERGFVWRHCVGTRLRHPMLSLLCLIFLAIAPSLPLVNGLELELTSMGLKAYNAAEALARSHQHASIMPMHLAAVLFKPGSFGAKIAAKAAAKAAGKGKKKKRRPPTATRDSEAAAAALAKHLARTAERSHGGKQHPLPEQLAQSQAMRAVLTPVDVPRNT